MDKSADTIKASTQWVILTIDWPLTVRQRLFYNCTLCGYVWKAPARDMPVSLISAQDEKMIYVLEPNKIIKLTFNIFLVHLVKPYNAY